MSKLSAEEEAKLESNFPKIFEFLASYSVELGSLFCMKEEFGIVRGQIEIATTKSENQRKAVSILYECLRKWSETAASHIKELRNKHLSVRNEVESGDHNKPSARGKGKIAE